MGTCSREAFNCQHFHLCWWFIWMGKSCAGQLVTELTRCISSYFISKLEQLSLYSDLLLPTLRWSLQKEGLVLSLSFFLSPSLPLSLPLSLSLYLFLSAVLNAFWGFVAKKWRQLMSYKFVKKRNMLKIVFRFLVFLILEKDTAIFSFTLKGFILWWPSRYEFGLCYLEAIKGWSTLRTADLVTCLESAVVKKKYFPFSNSNVSPYKRPKGVLA